jgi:hypothetical protein
VYVNVYDVLFVHAQALVQERTVQQDRWSKQQALLISTHDRYASELTLVSCDAN